MIWNPRCTSAAALTLIAGLVVLGCGDKLHLTDNQRRGKQIYEAFCDKCHKLLDPKSHTDAQWIAAADKYSIKLKLQPEEVALLKDYLTRANDSI